MNALKSNQFTPSLTQCASSILIAISMLTLSACGGGGGGDSSSGDVGATPSSTSATLSGVASKGLLLGANVDVYAVDPSTGKPTGVPLQHTTTSTSDGSYSVNGLTPGQVVIVQITPSTDTAPGHSTQMKDEATGQLATIPSGSNFILNAATTLNSTGGTTVNVTPFSEMAYQAAKKQVTSTVSFSSGLIQSANNQISTSLGISILTEAPAFDLKSGKPTNAAAVKLAAVSQMAKDGGFGACSGNAGNSANVLASVTCVVQQLALSSQGSGYTVTATAANALNAAQAEVDSSAVTDPQEVAKAGALVNAATKPVTVLSGDQLSTLQEAKSLIQSLRNTAHLVSDKGGTSSSLPARLQNISDEVKGAIIAMDPASTTVALAMFDAMSVMTVETWRVDSGGGFAVHRGGNPGAPTVGACQYFASSAFAKGPTSTTPTNYLGCRITHGVVDTGTAVYAVQTRLHIQQTGAASAALGSQDTFTVNSALVKQTGSDSTGAFVSDNSDPADFNGASTLSTYRLIATRTSNGVDPFDSSHFAYNGQTIVGELAPGVSKDLTHSLGTKQSVNVAMQSASTSNTNANTQVTLAGQFNAYNNSTLLSSVNLKPGSYLQTNAPVAGNVTHAVVSGGTGAHLVLDATDAAGSKVSGTLDLSNFLNSGSIISASKATPTTGVLTGTLTDSTGAELFDGQLTVNLQVLSSGNTDLKNGEFKGKLWVSSGSSLSVDITVSKNAASGLTSFSGNYSQTDGTTLLLSGQYQPSDDTQSVITFSTPSGMGVTIHHADQQDNLVKGSFVAGVLNLQSSRVLYADGSYEQY